MNVTPLRVILFVVAAIVAATGTAYFTGALDSHVGKTSNEMASLPDGKASSKDDRVGSKASSDAEEDTSEPATEDHEGASTTTDDNATETKDAAADDTADDVVVPGFDVVRVEPDGSLVIAGNAAPGAQVEVVDGATVIGETKAGPAGDFAVVLDDPLDPGDYQIVLRATAPDGLAATSKETAVVSVPDRPDGQVLALVEQPGEPSRLITVPDGGSGGTENAAATEDGSEPGQAARDGERKTARAETNGSEASGTEERTRDRNGDQSADGATRGETDDQGSDRAKNGQAGKDDETVAGKDDSSGSPTETASGSGSDEPGAERQAGEGEADKASEDRMAEASPEAARGNAGEEAAQSGGSRAGSADDGDASRPNVFIEAVEIDGDTVFVAGVSEPGRRVRVYANEILLGDARVSPGGRFLVEARRDLPVGDYIVRADLLSGNGREVVSRAAVPFERPEGDKVAAVAPRAEEAPDTSDNSAARSGASIAADDETTVAMRGEADAAAGVNGTASSSGNSTAAGGSGDGNEDSVAGRESTTNLSATGTESDVDRVAKADGGEVPASPDNGNEARGAGGVTAAKLEPVDHAVIIRRGDTLWQISRRVYGRGIRYTNIYLANQKQIRDPHWIWPGQVFAVPDKTSEGVAADMQAIGDQAVPLPDREEKTTETSAN